MLAAFRAENCAVILREVNGTVDYAVIVHFYKIALADFLIVGDEAFAVGAGDLKNMAAPDFLAVWILVNVHGRLLFK